MHYREAPWLIEYASHPELVSAFRAAGLLPAGCLVFDDGEDGTMTWANAYDPETNAYFLTQLERPAPVLATPDGTTLVEVSDMHGAPSVRVRSVLVNGTLVETLLRWPRVPPWPRRLERARFLTDVDTEMRRQAARGRVVRVVEGDSVEILAHHAASVAAVAEDEGSEPAELGTMDEVVSVWNAALLHGQQVERAVAVLTGSTMLSSFLLGVGLVLFGLLSAHSWWVVALGVVTPVTVWWAFPFLLVLFRRSGRWRPPFPWVVPARVVPLDPR